MDIYKPKQIKLNFRLLRWNSKKKSYSENQQCIYNINKNVFYFSGLEIYLQYGSVYIDPTNIGANIVINKTSSRANDVEIIYKFKNRPLKIEIVGQTITKTQTKFSLSNLETLEKLCLSLPKTDSNQHPDILTVRWYE